jgi:hypothetical protein
MRPLYLFALLAAAGCASSPGDGDVDPTRPHHMNFLVGGSFDRAGDGAALGAQYEHRKRGKLGLGGFADVAFGRDTSTAIGGALYDHPVDRWSHFAGPGVVFADVDGYVLALIGTSYAFPAGNGRVMPIGWIDFGGVDNAALFIGVGYGIDF